MRELFDKKRTIIPIFLKMETLKLSYDTAVLKCPTCFSPIKASYNDKMFELNLPVQLLPATCIIVYALRTVNKLGRQ